MCANIYHKGQVITDVKLLIQLQHNDSEITNQGRMQGPSRAHWLLVDFSGGRYSFATPHVVGIRSPTPFPSFSLRLPALIFFLVTCNIMNVLFVVD